MSYMTRIPGYPDRDDIRPGMASFVGTGPTGATCETCAHRGYHRTGKFKFNPRIGLIEETQYRAKGCRMFLKLHGKHGGAIDKNWRACKYYQRKQP